MNRFCLKVLPHLVITRSKPFRRIPEKPDIPDIEYKGSGIDIPKEGVGDISKKPDLTKMPALPTNPLAKVPVNKKNPKAPTIRPEVDPVASPICQKPSLT